MLVVALQDVDALNGAVHGNSTFDRVHVRPFQSAYLSDAQSCSQTDVDAKVAESEVLLDEVEYFFVVCNGQDLHLLGRIYCRVLDVPFAVVHPFVLHSKLHHHFQDNQNVLHRLCA